MRSLPKRSALKLVLAVGVAIATMGGDSSETLTGIWGGPQVRLSLTESGGKLELGCAAATIDSPVRLDKQGMFAVSGRYEQFASGQTDADAPPKFIKTRFVGHVDGDTLHLAVHLDGSKTPQDYTLQRGRRTKLINCM